MEYAWLGKKSRHVPAHTGSAEGAGPKRALSTRPRSASAAHPRSCSGTSGSSAACCCSSAARRHGLLWCWRRRPGAHGRCGWRGGCAWGCPLPPATPRTDPVISHRQRKASTREWRARGVPARIRRRRRGGCRGAARSPSAPSGISRTERPSVSPTKKQPTNIIRSSPQHFVMACRAGEGCVKDGPASRWSRCAPAPARPPARALARGTAAAHPC